MESMQWLMNWFNQNCDGDWEHNNSISISTLDNPGWSFKVNLTDTDDEGKELSIKMFNNDKDWYQIDCDGDTFDAVGDPSKLLLLIDCFRKLIDS